MMKPIQIAKALYLENVKSALGFEEMLTKYLGEHNGFVISTPTCFVMGNAVQLGDGKHAWFVDCAIGRLSELVKTMPFRLPFIAFCRPRKDREKVRFRVYPTSSLLRLVK